MRRKSLFYLIVVVFVVVLIGKLSVSGPILANGAEEKVKLKIKNKSQSGGRTLTGKIIVIDPGHGGNDAGSIGQHGTFEKDVTLKTAKMIKRELIKKTGATVYLTRDKDDYVSLQDRVRMAKEKSADLFISIHYDAFTTHDVKGITTYFDKNEYQEAAQIINRHLFMEDMGTKDRGVKVGDYYVLRENTQPAILLELGYISNSEEEKRMNSSKFQGKAAHAIVNGIIEILSPV